MTRTQIGRIAVTFGLALGFAGCRQLEDRDRDREQPAGKKECHWSEPDANGKRKLVCTTVIVIDTAQMKVCYSDSTGMGVGC